MRYGKLLLLLMIVLSLTACSTIKRWFGDENYTHHDQNIAPIAVPDDLSSHRIHQQYPVRGTQYPPRQSQRRYNPVNHSEHDTSQESLAPSGSMLERYQQKRMESQHQQTSELYGDELSLNESLKQAWETVGKALPKAGFQIMDDDGGLGTYYVVDTSQSGGKISVNSPIYQVHLQPQKNNKTIVTVLNAKNKPAKKQVSQQILQTLKKQLG